MRKAATAKGKEHRHLPGFIQEDREERARRRITVLPQIEDFDEAAHRIRKEKPGEVPDEAIEEGAREGNADLQEAQEKVPAHGPQGQRGGKGDTDREGQRRHTRLAPKRDRLRQVHPP
jgi:hypothetical protein